QGGRRGEAGRRHPRRDRRAVDAGDRDGDRGAAKHALLAAAAGARRVRRRRAPLARRAMKERDLEALLDAERRAPDPPAEARARVLHRVEVTVGLAAAAGAATATAAKAATTGAHTVAAAGAKAVIVKVVIGAVGAALLGSGAY